MLAIVQDRWGAPEDVLRLEEVPDPVIAKPDQVLVRVEAAGVDLGAWHMITGLPRMVRLATGFTRPNRRTFGWDAAGVVEAVGAEVAAFRPGDRVFGSVDGAFAELALAKATNLAPAPTSLAPEQAAVIPTSGITALQALRAAGALEPGRRVVVLGAAGGVGRYAVQLARHAGAAEIVGFARADKLELARDAGVDRALDYAVEPLAAAGGGFDVVLDTGGRRPIRELAGALAPGGVAVLVGGEGGNLVTGGFERVMTAGLQGRLAGRRAVGLMATAAGADAAELGRLADAGVIRPLVERVVPLARTAEAVARAGSGLARGKQAIRVAG